MEMATGYFVLATSGAFTLGIGVTVLLFKLFKNPFTKQIRERDLDLLAMMADLKGKPHLVHEIGLHRLSEVADKLFAMYMDAEDVAAKESEQVAAQYREDSNSIRRAREKLLKVYHGLPSKTLGEEDARKYMDEASEYLVHLKRETLRKGADPYVSAIEKIKGEIFKK